MKPKLLLLLSFMLCAVTANYAQISATQAGIAVQGIARDANNTAMASKTISLTFTLYYLNSSNIEENIYETTTSLATDSYGVFSYVIDPGAVNNSKFANKVAYLRIKNEQVLISDEKLRHVPYAISANNGVPTGCIMPFIGTVVPQGWVLCDGQVLTGLSGADNLIQMIGNKAPDLRAMFLRGTGTNGETGYTTYTGPALKGYNTDTVKAHKHTITNVTTTENGEHTHDTGPYNQVLKSDGFQTTDGNNNNSENEPNLATSGKIPMGGKHSHTLTGSTDDNGVAKETTPVNYGVNYIIKL